MLSRRQTILAGAALGIAPIARARAEGYPDRPVRMVVAYPPGGNVDFSARLIQPVMSRSLGQTLVVENKAGASGIVGTDSVARARPDGYTTLITGTAPVSIFPSAMEHLPYDPLRDFVPVGMAYRVPIVLVVSKDLRAANLAEFVALAKATPGGLSAGTAGIGSGAHLAIELFNAGTGAGLVHVPYRGTGPAVSDLIAGTIPVMFDQLSSAMQLHADGRARILGIASAARSPLIPEIETLREAGIVEPELSTTVGVLAPTGTPPEAIQKLNAALVAAMTDPMVRERLTQLGGDIPTADKLTPAHYGAVVREELEIYRRAVELGHVKLE